MHCSACMSMIITYQLIIALTVLVTNQNENVGDGSFPGFGLSEELIDIMIADDKICMMMTRLACNRAIESSYWRMDNDSDVGLLTGYVLYWLPVELEFMDLDTFPR